MPAALQELVAQPRLAHAGIADHAHDLSVTRDGFVERLLEPGELPLPADEARQPARARYVEARLQRARSLQLEHAHGLLDALQLEASQILELEPAGDDRGGGLAHVHRVGCSELLHARGETDRVPLRGVVHAQVAADLAHDDVAGVEAHANREVEPVLALHLARVAAELPLQEQRGVTGALRVVLVGDGRAEQRHDPVARVLVHRALVAVHPVGQDREEAVEDAMPRFEIDLRGELHRALHVREHHRDRLAFALDRRPAREHLLRQVARRVLDGRGAAQGNATGLACGLLDQALAATVAEDRAQTGLAPADGADWGARSAAACARRRVGLVRCLAAGADHSRALLPRRNAEAGV